MQLQRIWMIGLLKSTQSLTPKESFPRNFNFTFVLDFPKTSYRYLVASLLMIITFGLFRVVPIPIICRGAYYKLVVYPQYSSVYHKCMFSLYLLLSVMNLYWFYVMLVGLVKTARKLLIKNKKQEKSDKQNWIWKKLCLSRITPPSSPPSPFPDTSTPFFSPSLFPPPPPSFFSPSPFPATSTTLLLPPSPPPPTLSSSSPPKVR